MTSSCTLRDHRGTALATGRAALAGVVAAVLAGCSGADPVPAAGAAPATPTTPANPGTVAATSATPSAPHAGTVAPRAPAAPPSPPAPPPPSSAGLAAALDPLLRSAPLRAGVGAVVLTDDGTVRYDRSGDGVRVPASTAKLLTGAAALAVLGPQERLATRVVRGERPGEVVLVGGGDATLLGAPPPAGQPRGPRDFRIPAAATLPDLARATAAALRAEGARAAAVRVDDTLFTGPAVSPDWRASYVDDGHVGPVAALSVDAGRRRADSGKRVADPALEAGRRFASLLRAAGVRASAGEVRRGAAPSGGGQLAAVASPPVEVLVEESLRRSDNDIAESLGRLVAQREGQPLTFAGAAAAVTRVVERLGLPTGGTRLLDASGLARDSRVAPTTLGALLAAAVRGGVAQAGGPPVELAAVVDGLPVAGQTGSLADRYRQPAAAAGRGRVRAKTGTLNGVHAVAGLVRDRAGRDLIFAVLADRVPQAQSRQARDTLDLIGAALARCGCA